MNGDLKKEGLLGFRDVGILRRDGRLRLRPRGCHEGEEFGTAWIAMVGKQVSVNTLINVRELPLCFVFLVTRHVSCTGSRQQTRNKLKESEIRKWCPQLPGS